MDWWLMPAWKAIALLVAIPVGLLTLSVTSGIVLEERFPEIVTWLPGLLLGCAVFAALGEGTIVLFLCIR